MRTSELQLKISKAGIFTFLRKYKLKDPEISQASKKLQNTGLTIKNNLYRSWEAFHDNTVGPLLVSLIFSIFSKLVGCGNLLRPVLGQFTFPCGLGKNFRFLYLKTSAGLSIS